MTYQGAQHHIIVIICERHTKSTRCATACVNVPTTAALGSSDYATASSKDYENASPKSGYLHHYNTSCNNKNEC